MSMDAFGTGSRLDTYHSRSEGGALNGALRYPSPFFDISHTFLPTSVQSMFRWCRYYFMVNPLINAVSYKMAEYPITPLIFDEEDSTIRDKWTNIAENHLKLRSFQIEAGLDYFCYGNALVSIHFPFEKYLQCRACDHKVRVENAAYKYRSLQYNLLCEECGQTTEAIVDDHNIKNLKGIRLIRWNPEYVRIEHNEITGESDYFFEMPTTVRNDILMGKPHMIEKIPHAFIEAVRRNKSIRFTDDQIFHLKRPTIAQKDMGWGMPLILPVLKDTYYLQILRKAQEAIAQQHIVPLRILFPQAGSASSDPFSMTDLGMWRKRIESEIQKWRQDPNYIPILPLPVGNEVIGGEGKALMLHQEMRAWSEQIVAGMHVPIEFVFGGLQYSGSNVSMRMLENQFLGYRTMQLIMVRDFILGRVADYMGWKRPRMRFKRFKMADDLQRSALNFQINQAQKISDTTLLDDMDFDLPQEEKYKAAELQKQLDNQRKMQIANANLQGELQVIQARYAIQVQKMMGEAGMGQPGAGADGQQAAQMVAGDPSQQMPGGGQMPGQETQQPLQGQEIAPGVPDSVTVYPENAGEAPQEGVPAVMQSPLNLSLQQGGMSLLHIARKVATDLEKKDEQTKQSELFNMKTSNPELYKLVSDIITSGKGSQKDPFDPIQSPLPEFKPPRAA